MKSFVVILATLTLCVIKLDAQITQEFILAEYEKKAEKLIDAIMSDSTAYQRLGYLTDVFGSRLSGSANLERALDWMYAEMKSDGLDNVTKDSVMVPHWVRGLERCDIISPLNHNMLVASYGGSISTPDGGITAEVYVVNSFEQLKNNADKAKGKIVVYNAPFLNYGQAVQYRFHGAVRAAEVGAVASLARSVTPQNMNSVHTGMMVYVDSITKIPHGAITIEDAELLQRLQDRGITPKIKLVLESETLPDALSYNLYSELSGIENPDEIIAHGGHIDSWDMGTGAHDDACACVASWEVIRKIKQLNLKPKRTLRAVMWANEENGVRGGNAYRDKHKDEKHVLMFEFDSGCFAPSAIRFSGSDTLLQIVKFFEPILRKIDSIEVVKGGGGVDIGPMTRLGYPAMSLSTRDRGQYFSYHHSRNDTFDKIVFSDYNKCIAAIAVSLFIYSDLPIEYYKYIELKK